jgi:hypothetical protein
LASLPVSFYPAQPARIDKLGQLVEEHWFMLGKVASQQNIELLRQIGQLAHFAAYSDAEIWEKVEAMQNTAEVDADAPPLSLKAPEVKGRWAGWLVWVFLSSWVDISMVRWSRC